MIKGNLVTIIDVVISSLTKNEFWGIIGTLPPIRTLISDHLENNNNILLTSRIMRDIITYSTTNTSINSKQSYH